LLFRPQIPPRRTQIFTDPPASLTATGSRAGYELKQIGTDGLNKLLRILFKPVCTLWIRAHRRWGRIRICV